jgi:hypothetical protein
MRRAELGYAEVVRLKSAVTGLSGSGRYPMRALGTSAL